MLADDAVRSVPAGARLPQAAVALDPEAGVGGEDGEGHVVRLPVAVGHLGVLAPHQASTCSSQKQPEPSSQGGGGRGRSHGARPPTHLLPRLAGAN